MTSITVELIPLTKWFGGHVEYCTACHEKDARYMVKPNTFFADYEVCEDCASELKTNIFSIQGSGAIYTLNKDNILYLCVNEQECTVDVKFTDGMAVKFVTSPHISEIINPRMFCNFKQWKTATNDVWFTNTSRVLYWSVDKTSVTIKFLHNVTCKINNLIDHNANLPNTIRPIDPLTKLTVALNDLCIADDNEQPEYPGDSLPTPKVTLEYLNRELDAIVAARNIGSSLDDLDAMITAQKYKVRF
jgi:hypothetical protein